MNLEGQSAGGLVSSLTEIELRMLEFERGWWRSPGAKEREILQTFEMAPTRYYQLLNELIDRPEAVAHDPELVARLRRRRVARGSRRSGRQS